MKRLRLSLWFLMLSVWTLINPNLGSKVAADFIRAERQRESDQLDKRFNRLFKREQSNTTARAEPGQDKR